ncbi:DNA repair protein [Calycina marina]|uniref:Double-strand break repair protein n=1 Tax=Calycina marina TaxID=1763456 RepID=A0A9P8CBP5_9HELO|nr:DNA repair protein [Calycina marina]
MALSSDPDTIKILIATDSHVGYEERDPVRKDDSWRSFDEILKLAKSEDVDMVLLAGDLFHDNQPSRKAMFQVMKSLRTNCLGERPCELEMLSDPSEVLNGDHVNYEDPDINVSIPVFSIHGNHDDPTGEGNYCALDLLQVSGLLNYIGRMAESDNINVKPVLLQKGQTKLALYGMSNVRDERLYRTFRDGKVKFFTPGVQQDDWYNIMAVHQNHHGHTETGYLPENFLPDFMDLIVWGHEHECLIEPRFNDEMQFHVMQPGSSVATSLCAGEAVAKHVAIAYITGKTLRTENVRIKSVRPFIMRDIVLADDERFLELAHKSDNRLDITALLVEIVEKIIEEAIQEWTEIQEPDDMPDETPLPLVRLRVNMTAPEDGGKFDVENPQRFSSRFVGKVANIKDVVLFQQKKRMSRTKKNDPDLPEGGTLTHDDTNSALKVDKLLQEYCNGQSLQILAPTAFGDAVNQFVKANDTNAMEVFVDDTLATRVEEMLRLDEDEDEDDLHPVMHQLAKKQEELLKAGALKAPKKKKRKGLKPRPDIWDSDIDGLWDLAPEAYSGNDAEQQDDGEDEDGQPKKKAPAKKATTKRAPAKPKAPAKAKTPATAVPPQKKAPTRGYEKAAIPIQNSDDDDDDDDIMIDSALQVKTKSLPKRGATKGRQSQLNFSQEPKTTQAAKFQLSDDEISDEDAFEPIAKATTRKR